MTFEEKKDDLLDNKEKCKGIPFMLLLLLACIVGIVCIVLMKSYGNKASFNIVMPDSFTLFLRFGNAVIRLFGIMILFFSVKASCKKLFEYRNTIPLYSIVVGNIMGMLFLLFGTSVIVYFVTSIFGLFDV